jgi:serine/threonine-protein kinase
MFRASAGGGNPVPLLTSDSSKRRTGMRWPVVLPNEKAIVFSTGSSAAAEPKLGVMTLDGGNLSEFNLPVAMALGMSGDRLVYVSPGGALMAVEFDVSALRPVGDPVQVDEGILVEGQNGAKASLSASGTLAYIRGRAEFQMVLMKPGSSSGDPVLPEAANYLTPRFSPDAREIAVTVSTPKSTDIWVYNISRNTFTRVTTEGLSFLPEWSPDGRDVIFLSSRGGKTAIYRQRADASGPSELVYDSPYEPFETIVSPDNKWLIIRTAPGAKYSRDILGVPLSGDRVSGNPPLTGFATGPETENMPRFSPDGKWMAYESNESGRFEVYVRPFPGDGARIQVSDNGGSEPVWSRSGKSLYYRDMPGHIIEVKVTTDNGFSIGERKIALDDTYLRYATHANYDVAADGRFLVLKRSGAESQTIVVHNWGRELREKTAKH